VAGIQVRKKESMMKRAAETILHEENSADGRTSTTSIWSAGKHFDKAER
jgi:hypothetical protein